MERPYFSWLVNKVIFFSGVLDNHFLQRLFCPQAADSEGNASLCVTVSMVNTGPESEDYTELGKLYPLVSPLYNKNIIIVKKKMRKVC